MNGINSECIAARLHSRHSVTYNLINFHCSVNMTSQQEDLHIDVGCYSPPTATDATIIGTNGAQPKGEYAGLDPLWVQPSGNHCNGTSFDAPLGLDTIPTQTIHYQPQLEQLGDFDAIVPLPEHLLETLPNEITPLDPAPFLPNSQAVPTLFQSPVLTLLKGFPKQLLICRNLTSLQPRKRAVLGLTIDNHNKNNIEPSFILTLSKLDQRRT